MSKNISNFKKRKTSDNFFLTLYVLKCPGTRCFFAMASVLEAKVEWIDFRGEVLFPNPKSNVTQPPKVVTAGSYLFTSGQQFRNTKICRGPANRKESTHAVRIWREQQRGAVLSASLLTDRVWAELQSKQQPWAWPRHLGWLQGPSDCRWVVKHYARQCMQVWCQKKA